MAPTRHGDRYIFPFAFLSRFCAVCLPFLSFCAFNPLSIYLFIFTAVWISIPHLFLSFKLFFYFPFVFIFILIFPHIFLLFPFSSFLIPIIFCVRFPFLFFSFYLVSLLLSLPLFFLQNCVSCCMFLKTSSTILSGKYYLSF